MSLFANKHRAICSGLAASIIRFDEFFHADAIKDGSWTVQLPIWTMVEPNLYLIAACLVTFHPLLKKILILTGWIKASVFSYTGKSSRSGRSHGGKLSTADHLQQSQNSALKGEATSQSLFRGRRKMGKNDLESLGNTFDMNDTVDGEADETGDDIRLVRLQQIPEVGDGKGATAKQTEMGTNQIQVRSDIYVRSE
jgi:hypothetical protein